MEKGSLGLELTHTHLSIVEKMLNLTAALSDLDRRSGLSELLREALRSGYFNVVPLLLGGLLFFVVVLFRRAGQRGELSSAPADSEYTRVPRLEGSGAPASPPCGGRDGQEATGTKGQDAVDKPDGQTWAGLPESTRVTPGCAATDNRQPKKKKTKRDKLEEKVRCNVWLFSKEKSEDEDSGLWERKMSSKERRQLRKERMKRKGTTCQQVGTPEAPTWQSSRPCPSAERESPVNMTPQEMGKAGPGVGSPEEEDIFSHVGTWSSKDMKTGSTTKSEQWSSQTALQNMEDTWFTLEDPLDMDQLSDWKPPREEWGNWDGETGMKGQNGVQIVGTGPKHCQLEARTTFVPCQLLADGTDAKKDKRRKRRMRKTT